jgi:hypothetical protein
MVKMIVDQFGKPIKYKLSEARIAMMTKAFKEVAEIMKIVDAPPVIEAITPLLYDQFGREIPRLFKTEPGKIIFRRYSSVERFRKEYLGDWNISHMEELK